MIQGLCISSSFFLSIFSLLLSLLFFLSLSSLTLLSLSILSLSSLSLFSSLSPLLFSLSFLFSLFLFLYSLFLFSLSSLSHKFKALKLLQYTPLPVNKSGCAVCTVCVGRGKHVIFNSSLGEEGCGNRESLVITNQLF